MEEAIARLNALRRIGDRPNYSLCYAPSIQLSFTPDGNASVCCRSRHVPVGNVATSTLDEIWRGPKARAFRIALARDVMPAGCSECARLLKHGVYENHPILDFDHIAPDPELRWPTLLEFALSNRCNLECVHCTGDFSSLIRAKEGLPPLPDVYGDRFFAELRDYLPHVRATSFVGGEPFLQPECYAIWDAMAELGCTATIFVTTNGTVWNAKVERLLEKLPIDVGISLDGLTRETVESIRVNARHTILTQNVKRFRDAALRRKAGEPPGERFLVQTNFCLMPRNWREVGDFFLWAEELDATMWITVVTSPERESLFSLPARELAQIADDIDRQGDVVLSRLGKINRPKWEAMAREIRSEADSKLRAEN